MSKPEYTRIPSLMDEAPINFYPYLAKLIGVNEAIVLQQIWFHINSKRSQKKTYHYREGKWWVYNSYKEWCDEFFIWLKPRGLQGIILNLESKGVLISMQGVPNKHDRRKWYTVNHEALDKLIEADLGHSAENEPYSADDALSIDDSMHHVDVHEMYDDSTEIEVSTEKSTERTTYAPSGAGEVFTDTMSAEDVSAIPNASLRLEETPAKPVRTKKPENATAQTPATTAPIPVPPPLSPDVAKSATTDTSAPRVTAAGQLANALGLKIVEGDGAKFGKVAAQLNKAGITSDEFSAYVEYWRDQSSKTGSWPVTLHSLTANGRMSVYVSVREELQEKARIREEKRLAAEEYDKLVIARYPTLDPNYKPVITDSPQRRALRDSLKELGADIEW